MMIFKCCLLMLATLAVLSVAVLADNTIESANNKTGDRRINSKQQQQDSSKVVSLDGQQQVNPLSSQTNGDDGEDSIETSPSITSVHHQVWTSSSSGSLDELSPEIISKLRQDVPFLAAYALRPRLVGVSPPAARATSDAADDSLDPDHHHLESRRIAASTNLESPPALIQHQDRSMLVAATAETFGGKFESPPRSLDSGSSSNAQPRTAATAAIGKQSAKQTSLIPQLGDFSELNVETSSTSKSEHHHKRKTSLKRRQQGRNDRELDQDFQLGTNKVQGNGELRRRMIAEASRLIRKRRQHQQGKQPLGGRRNRRQSSRSASKSNLAKSSSNQKRNKSRKSSRLRAKSTQKLHQTRVGRLKSKLNRQNLQHHMNIIKHGRLQDTENAVKGDEAVRTTSDDGVKGGSKSNKKPFYANGKAPPTTQDDAATDDQDGGNRSKLSPDAKRRPSATEDGKPRTPDLPQKNEIDVANNVDDDEDDGLTSIDDEQSEPRRVGDDDVEEDGDTVMVEPKFDGVEDDPPLPGDGQEEDGQGGMTTKSTGGENDLEDDLEKRPKVGGERETDTPSTGPPSGGEKPLAAEGDERGNRVNRERPNSSGNQPAGTGSGDDDDDDDGANQAGPSLVTGGGIGATTGSGGGDNGQSGGSRAGGVDAGVDQTGDDDEDRDARRRPTTATSPGVELASDEDDGSDGRKSTGAGSVGGATDDKDDGAEDDKGTKSSTGGANAGRAGGGDSTEQDSGDGDFGSRKSERPESDSSSGRTNGGGDRGRGDNDRRGGGVADDTDDVDLDYRDEMAKGDADDETRSMKDAGKSQPGRGEMGQTDDDGQGRKSPRKQQTKDCVDDGSYREHDEKYHDEHHQRIDWLRGSIQGEPGEDYPIQSRVNGTNFNCANHKYPGYYADVESRCQEFHICQADGRQDSFLCPNGTVFSQKTLVCVWWNGFDCEEAPKYYHLNALLFRSRDGNDSPQSAALPSLNSNLPAGKASTGPSTGGELRPLDDGAQLKPRRKDIMRTSLDADNNNSDDVDSGGSVSAKSSIDDLIRAMRRERPQANSISGDDEATIQRKSTNIGDDEQSAEQSSARLMKGAIRRRKRRANVRQAPPKLKSRRISRNSRRRKLRHGIKPRRRA